MATPIRQTPPIRQQTNGSEKVVPIRNMVKRGTPHKAIIRKPVRHTAAPPVRSNPLPPVSVDDVEIDAETVTTTVMPVAATDWRDYLTPKNIAIGVGVAGLLWLAFRNKQP